MPIILKELLIHMRCFGMKSVKTSTKCIALELTLTSKKLTRLSRRLLINWVRLLARKKPRQVLTNGVTHLRRSLIKARANKIRFKVWIMTIKWWLFLGTAMVQALLWPMEKTITLPGVSTTLFFVFGPFSEEISTPKKLLPLLKFQTALLKWLSTQLTHWS